MNSQHFRRFAVLMIASIIALSACARSTEMPKDETTHDFTASQEIETIPDTSREDLSPSYPVTSLTINGIRTLEELSMR